MYQTVSPRFASLLLPVALGWFAINAQAEDAAPDRITTYTYTTQNQIKTIDGPRTDVADVTTYGYDSQGNRNLVRNALGHETRISAFDADGRPLTIVDPNGLTTTLTYYPQGYLHTRSVSDGTDTRTTEYRYDSVGNLLQVTSADGRVLKYEYDDANRVKAMEDGEGNRVEYTLDAMGHRLRTETKDTGSRLLALQRQEFDTLGRLIKSIDAQEHVTGYGYDDNGNRTTVTDALLHLTQTVYDVLDRRHQVTDALNGVTEYGYDGQDNITRVTDPNGQVTRYVYDGLGNRLSETSPNTGTTGFTYDAAGNMVTRTDARGVSVTLVYDALNRLTAMHYPDNSQDVSYGYDEGVNGIGRLTSMRDASGTTTYGYNAFGQILAVRRVDDSGALSDLGYRYDSAGRLFSRTYPSGQTVFYGYDAQSRIERVELGGSGTSPIPLVSNVQYLPFGSIRGYDYGNGLRLSRDFDQNYRLSGQTIAGILESGYQYDPTGNLSDWYDRLDANKNQHFAYDELNRLSNAGGAYGDLGYRYDGAGNRLSKTHDGYPKTYTYANDSQRLMRITNGVTETRAYDAVGNTLQMGALSLSYNDANRLSQVVNGAATASYGYNGRGERVRKTVGGQTRTFLYDGRGRLLHEANGDGGWQRDYVYLDNELVALLDESAAWSGFQADGGNAPSVDQQNGGVTVTEAALDSDRSYFAYRPLADEGSVSAKIGAVKGDFAGAEVGVELRESLAANANYVRIARRAKRTLLLVDAGAQVPLALPQKESVRVTYQDGGGVHSVDYDPLGYQYFKLDVSGGYASVSASADGALWTQLGNALPVTVSSTTVMGFAVSHLAAGSEARFENIATEGMPGTISVYAVHSTHLGTPQVITDANREVVWEADYLPFGETLVTTDTIENSLRFPGQYFDPESGLYYNYHRDYDPSTGRYIESDPIGLSGGTNTYAYVSGNPINSIDPKGLVKCNCIKINMEDINHVKICTYSCGCSGCPAKLEVSAPGSRSGSSGSYLCEGQSEWGAVTYLQQETDYFGVDLGSWFERWWYGELADKLNNEYKDKCKGEDCKKQKK